MNDLPHPSTRLRALPKVQALLDGPAAPLVSKYPRALVRDAIRAALDRMRRDIQRSDSAVAYDEGVFLAEVEARLARVARRSLQRVINATGIVVHTNLGRAPLAPEAVEAVHDVAAGSTNLEYDLDSGARGSRYIHVETLLTELTGAEGALVVNNGAAAVLLALNTFAAGADVILSRGEMIEIGGAFRMPDVVSRSGARLVEVGTTNRTRIGDYRDAMTDETRVLLRVHPSNYRIVGFTERPSRAALVELARERDCLAFEDLGSGVLVDLQPYGLPSEDTVRNAVRAGLDLVTFSGDKLLGGPQAGILVGSADCIASMRTNPLLRALRIDKLSLAGLEATLHLYREGDPVQSLPVLRMLAQDLDAVEARARVLASELSALPDITTEVAPSEAFAGGGALPDQALPSFMVRVAHASLDALDLAAAFRRARPAVIGRVTGDAFVLDAFTLAETDIEAVRDAAARVAP